jgi:hypothetical protein
MNKFISLSVIPLATTATVASVIIASASANAISLTVGGIAAGDGSFLTTGVIGTTVIDFNSGTLPSIYTSGGGIVSGTLKNKYARPANDTTKYYSVGPSTGSTLGIIKKADGPAWNYFGLYWGSIDAYNNIAFYNNGSLVSTFNGSAAANVPNGDQFGTDTNRYVNFFSTGPGDYFDEIRFISNRNAFESDNHAFREVPEPLTILGTGIALGFGGLFKSKSSKKQSANT